jgi:hypothetical protein
VDRKPEKAVQAKIRDTKKKTKPGRLKTRKGNLGKKGYTPDGLKKEKKNSPGEN